MPGEVMGAVMFGSGISGVAMNVQRGVLQWLLPGDDNLFTLALLFFNLGAIILWVCAYIYTPLFNNQYFLYFFNQNAGNLEEKLLGSDPLYEGRTQITEKAAQMTLGDLISQGKQSLKKAWSMLLSMWFLFSVTFLIFPGAFFKSHLNMMDGMQD